MKRIGILAATAVLGTSLLSGCGGGDDYCDTLSDARGEFSAVGSGDIDSFDDFRDVTSDLADSAPDEVADDWETIEKAFNDLESAMDDAGVNMEDLDQMSESGELPEGVSQEDLMALGEELQSVGDGINESGDAITEHAKESCDIDLNDPDA
ncbi:hypothetical protein [Nocardioides sp. zg-DK7169]|uniref:hypothetical protein n=1 Tax=Nocardioides sp. zg-DK7169 TaxID=2736600 RepID=UPI001551E2A2|nr:hypothetical protein [Nocardioides sp. zg-DK7169]NPC96472.1 hypothetical protein [Nocardioides sp. zg-DK7169]